MANTYTQIYIHFVFAVRFRKAQIHPEWEVKLHKYITGIVQNKGHKMLAINGMPDHLHLFIGYQPNESISELIKVVKTESTKWVIQKKLVHAPFSWQEGYGAFSHSRSQVDHVCKYIQNQKQHHLKKSFYIEYIEMLKRYDIPYDERYIFKDLE